MPPKFRTLRKYQAPDSKNIAKPSTVREPADSNERYISNGNYGSIVEKDFILERANKSDSKKVTLVEKSPEDGSTGFEKKEIERQIKIHDILKRAGIPTFNTFRTDGKNFYSTPLNSDNVLAISHNNPFRIGDGNIFQGRFKIKNELGVVNKINQISKKAASFSIKLPADSLFFLVDKKELISGLATIIEVFVGDLDGVKIVKEDETGKLEKENKSALFDALTFLKNKY